MHTNEELDNLLQMPLEDKITMSKLRITAFLGRKPMVLTVG